MKTTTIILLFILGLIGLGNYFTEPKKYRVRISFCDNREPKYFLVETIRRPSNEDISNYNTGVPVYMGHLNVCDIEVLQELPIK